MMKHEVLKRIVDSGVVAVVRGDTSEQAARIAEACAEGGVAAVEITFSVRGATDVILELSRLLTATVYSWAPAPFWIQGRPGPPFFPTPRSWSVVV